MTQDTAVKHSGGALTEGSVTRHILRMAIPMAFGLIAIMSVDLIDAFWIAQLGKDELVAIGFAMPITGFFLSLGIGLSVGASMKLAQFLGSSSGSYYRARCFVVEVLIITTVITSFFVVLGLISIDPLFRMLGASGKVLLLVHDYMAIWYLGMVAVVVPMLGNSLIRATGSAVWPSVIMVVASLLNALLDPLLMFGWGPVPALGIKGAAWATVIVRALACTAIIAVLHWEVKLIYWHLPKFSALKNSFLLILPASISSTLSFVIAPVANALIISIIATIGNAEVAGFNIGLRIESVALVLAMSVSASCAPIVAQNYGARDTARLLSIRKSVFAIIAFTMLPIGLASMLFAAPLSFAFGEHPDVQHIVTLYLLFIPISWVARGISMCSVNMLNAVDQPVLSVLITIMQSLVLYVPLALLLKNVWGFQGVLYAAVGANIVAGIVSFYLTRKECAACSSKEKKQAS